MRIPIQDLEIDDRPKIEHHNYLEYLAVCWNTHYEVVVSPDFIWFPLLCEVAGIVKADPEQYRSLFSTSDKKEEISIETPELVVMPVDLLFSELKRFVPTEADTFIPVFSESTEDYRLAAMTAFADMTSPYYNYSMYLCGLSAVHLEGTVEDWQKLKVHWGMIRHIIGERDGYFAGVEGIIDQIINQFDSPSPEFWNSMFRLERCGSGSQVEVEGWITEFFTSKPRPAYTKNFSSNIAEITYKQIDTQKRYKMQRGLFESTVEGQMLRPSFGCTVEELKEEE
jgi:hypothetical protein